MPYLILLFSAYTIGSIPSAYIFGRIFGKIDIRSAGSGNVGGMNAYRVAGLTPGILTVITDIAKGILVVAIAQSFTSDLLVVLACAFFAVAGHNYSIFIGFKGGKGLATALGVFLILSPFTIIYLLLFTFTLLVLMRDTNTAFGSSVVLLPIILAIQYSEITWILFGLALAVIITAKHLNDFRAYRQGRRKIK
ncbi:MAG: glycerol-3-phosphate acyltransferase [Bacillota bacterium]|nr:glycerol-3-phosphate acyltransferase [Bacillota bacterium]